MPDKQEINNLLQNSKIVKYIKKETNKIVVQDIRIKDDITEDVLEVNEYYISSIINNVEAVKYTYNKKKFNPLGL
jgi:hypothetical protein